MRIEELFEEKKYIGLIPIITIKGDMKDFVKSRKDRPLGFGTTADTYTHPKHLNAVIKVVKINEKYTLDNGLVQATNLFLEHQDNPHFPKIYSAKIYIDKFKNRTMVVSMEKLHPATKKELQDIFLSILNNIGFKDNTLTDAWLKNPNSAHFARILSDMFLEFKTSKLSPKFNEAMQLVLGHTLLHDSFLDLHQDNIMIRLTGHGPQLVLVDPFASDEFE